MESDTCECCHFLLDLSEPTKLESKGGFRLNQHRLCCWVLGTENADNKLWKCVTVYQRALCSDPMS